MRPMTFRVAGRVFPGLRTGLVWPVCITAGAFASALASAAGLGLEPADPIAPVPPECRCRAPDGSLQDLGTVQCVDITGSRRLVQCVMSTNTPYWRQVDGVEGCPVT